jgi:hypothetical protein
MPNNDTAAQVERLREKADSAKASAKACRSEGYYALADDEQIWGDVFTAAADALEREARLVADAARYRWIRQDAEIAWFGRDEEMPEDRAVYEVKLLLSFPSGCGSQPERFDAAVDAARSKP